MPQQPAAKAERPPKAMAPPNSGSSGATKKILAKAAAAKVVEAPIVRLQAGRKVQSVDLRGLATPATATLVNLVPSSGTWYLLEIVSETGTPAVYHLETISPGQVELSDIQGGSLRLVNGGLVTFCVPWSGTGGGELASARGSGFPFVPICDGRLYLRNPASGRRSYLEKTADFLRDRVKGGEAITTFVKDTVFKDRYLQTGSSERAAREYVEPTGAPPAVAISQISAENRMAPSGLAVALDGVRQGRMEVGRWYPATGVPGVFLSVLEAGQVPAVRPEHRAWISPLDGIENSALTYLVAFDLSLHELGFALGTDHPRVGWSDRSPPQDRDPSLAGPDGLDSAAPLARTGVLAPHWVSRVSSTFTGGFKRSHGAFKFGDLASKNRGSHYGFVESGTVFSRLQPDLATVVTWNDGRSEILTWQRELDSRSSQVRHARQNGVPLVDTDPVTGWPRPGKLVSRWGEGNWSGSQDEKLRTLRAGLCQVDADGKRFFVYGYFSGATPSAMARVFLATGCQYAIHLDMNALEHTYLALYRTVDGRFLTEHLIEGMSVLDPEKNGAYLPRFVAVPDNRDFFYFLRKDPAQP